MTRARKDGVRTAAGNDALIADIERVLAKSGVSESQFGTRAMNDRRLLRHMREGRQLGPATLRAVRWLIAHLDRAADFEALARANPLPVPEVVEAPPIAALPMPERRERETNMWVRSADITRNRDASSGSQALLRAHLRTGAHWITDPDRFAEACASVGLVATPHTEGERA